jgi:hypothetical protein
MTLSTIVRTTDRTVDVMRQPGAHPKKVTRPRLPVTSLMYEGITNLSDKELILLLDRAWEEHRRRQGFEAPREPPANHAK